MHSSRMRTARLLPVPPGMHCSQGEVHLVRGEEGLVLGEGVYLVPGVYLVLGVVYLVPGGVPAQVTPLWTESQTPVKI